MSTVLVPRKRSASRADLVLRRTAPVELPVPDASRFDDIQIDWDYLIERRESVLAHSENLPPYLLRPEVHSILETIPRKSQLQANTYLLFATLWNTGARISEALALTKRSFHLDARGPYVSLKTLKKRGRLKKTAKGVVSPVAPRMVPLRNPAYLEFLHTYLELMPLKSDERIFKITRQAADMRIKALLAKMDEKSKPPIDVSCHTFRHAFAVNCLLHGTSIAVLQRWLGHANIESTVVYTQVLTVETGHLIERVQF